MHQIASYKMNYPKKACPNPPPLAKVHVQYNCLHIKIIISREFFYQIYT